MNVGFRTIDYLTHSNGFLVSSCGKLVNMVDPIW